MALMALMAKHAVSISEMRKVWVEPVRVKKNQEFGLGCVDCEMPIRRPRGDVEYMMSYESAV